MTDDEIIKALECCDFTDIKACEECPLYHTFDCSFVIIDKTLDLVNRQNAEIERLKQENKEYCEDNRIIAYQRNQRDKEIRALHNQLNGLNFMDKQIKFEAIKEFAERVKMAFYYEFEELIPSIMTDKIDEIVKEMTDVQENGNK